MSNNYLQCAKKYYDDFMKEFIEFCKIPSYFSEDNKYPYGKNCDDCLVWAIDWCKNNGANNVYIDPTRSYGYADFGTGDNTLAVMSHLDVVEPGDLSGWDTDPFVPTIKGNYIYGRGVSDTKGPDLAAMYAIKVLISDYGYNLSNKKVRFIFGLNEEISMKSLLKYKEDFGEPNLGAIVTEPASSVVLKQKGKIACNLILKNADNFDFIMKGGRDYNIVCDKVDITFLEENLFNKFVAMAETLKYEIKFDNVKKTVVLHGRPAHASLPELGVNAINKVCNVFEKIDYKKNRLINFINTFIKDDYNAKHIFGNSKDETGMLTVNSGFIDINENEAKAGIDLRIPSTIGLEETKKQLVNHANINGLVYDEYFCVSDVNHKNNMFAQKMLNLVTKYSVDKVERYIYMGAVSYSNIFKKAYTICVSQDLENLEIIKEIKEANGAYIPHSYNERYLITNLSEQIAFYAELIRLFLENK